jgi:hypothetical protein
VVVHHADFAVPVVRRLRVETSRRRPDGSGAVAGQVIALGWWVDAPGSPPSEEPPTGTLYLVVDESLPRPVWVAQGDLIAVALDD